MKFQIEKLIIWPKNKMFSPRIVKFELGKVNVITGASRTGKSAIIPIIDYCLASSDCFIPIDTIRDYASWYGIIVQTATEKILFARRVPHGNKASDDFFIMRGEGLSLPPVIVDSNQKIADVKLLLNTIVATPYFNLGDEDDQSYKARLSFRDLMALVFQSQEIIANQNILFYKTHAHEHRERLRNWFPYILGAESLDVLKARNRLKALEMQLKKLNREFEEVSKVSDGWLSNMRGLLNVAREYGLLQKDIFEDSTPEQLLHMAKDVLENIPDQSRSDSMTIGHANEEIALLEKNDEDLSASIGITKKRLADVQRLRNSFLDYGGGIKRRTDRLQISKWMQSIASKSAACPVCGSSDNPIANNELKKISEAFEQYEDTSKRMVEIPTSFDREEEMLKKDLNGLLDKKKSLQSRFDLSMAQDKEAQRNFQKRKNMYLFLGHLKAALEVFERLSDGGDLKQKIEELEAEQKALLEISGKKEVKRLLDFAVVQIAHNTLEHLKTLDVEEKYSRVAPRFSIQDLSVAVPSDDGNWHFLAEVGSASNWVSFHLALMCGLQEFFLSQEYSVVPSFVIFDQPSQVYFPKLKKGSNSNNDLKYETDEDVNAVKCMFETLSDSVGKSNGGWQAIVLDHADASVYGDIKEVFEVEVWRDGTKLIPEEWYRKDTASKGN